MKPAHIADSPGAPRARTWTVAQLHLLGELGLLEGRRAKLVDGVLLEEGAATPPHATCLELTSEVLRAAFGAGWRVRMPLVLGPTTDPVPDLALVAGSARGTTAHPHTPPSSSRCPTLRCATTPP